MATIALAPIIDDDKRRFPTSAPPVEVTTIDPTTDRDDNTEDLVPPVPTTANPDTDRDDSTSDDTNDPDDDDDAASRAVSPSTREPKDGKYLNGDGTIGFLKRGWLVTLSRAGTIDDGTVVYAITEERFLGSPDPRPGDLGA